MGGTRKQAELTLLAKVDEQTRQRSIKALREIQAAEQGVTAATTRHESALGGVSDATRRNINAVRLNITAARQENLNRQRAIADLGKEASKRREVAQAADQQASSVQRAARQGGQSTARAGGGSGGPDLGRVGLGASSLAAVLPGGAGNAVRGLADVIGVLDDVPRAVAEIKPALAGLTGSIGGLAAAGAAGIALAALAIALQKFIKDISEAQEGLTNATDAQVRYFELVETGTAEEIQTELKRAEVARRAREAVIQQLEVEQARLGIFGEMAKIFGIGPAKEIERLSEEIENLDFQIDPLRRALSSTEVQTRSAAEAAKEQSTSVETATRAEVQRTQATERATVAIDQQRQQLALFYENLVERANESTQQSAQAERDLVMERQRIYADYAERIKDQERQDRREQAREERRAAYDRVRAAIEGQDEAFELALDRNFSGLARFRRGEERNAALERLDNTFNANEERIARRERDEDNQLSLQRQLAQLTERTTQTRMQAAQTELEVARQVVAEWFKAQGYLGDVSRFTTELIMRYYRIIVGLGRTTIANPSITSRAFGGSLAAGQWSTVNELPGQRESFNGSLLPAGPGLFMPLQGGNVTPGGAGQVINVTYHISGPDPRSIQRQIESSQRDLVRRLARD